MKYISFLIILVSFSTIADSNKIDGSFSARKEDMICRGYWDHPFIPIVRNYGGRIPSTPLLTNEGSSITIKQQKLGVEISKQDSLGKVEFTNSIQAGFKGIRIANKKNSIVIKQYDALEVIFDYGTYIGIVKNMRFKAILTLNSNNDLILENYYRKNGERLEKRIECILPRI